MLEKISGQGHVFVRRVEPWHSRPRGALIVCHFLLGRWKRVIGELLQQTRNSPNRRPSHVLTGNGRELKYRGVSDLPSALVLLVSSGGWNRHIGRSSGKSQDLAKGVQHESRLEKCKARGM